MEENANPYKCESCGREFEKASALRLHLMHEKKRNEKLKVEVETSVEGKVEVEKKEDPKIKPYDFNRYKELPSEVRDYLEKTWGNWVNHFEVGMEDRKDFGGYAIYVRVPREFSVEWKTVRYTKYDNVTRRATGEYESTVEDIRHCTMSDRSKVKTWLDGVKKHIIDNAFAASIRLPMTNVKYETPNKTKEDYVRELAGI